MKIAIVHDYLNQAGGAERVVGTLHTMFPGAPIFTTILDRSSLWDVLRDADIRTSWMQKLPLLKRHFKAYLLFYPGAIERFDLREFDLVISSSSAFGKAAITRPGALHICYCHTPMRFVWDYERYMEREQYGSPVRAILVPVLRRFRTWDVKTASRPNLYVANSTVVADRIKRFYGRDSVIVPPPVAVQRFTPVNAPEDFYLIVSRLNPYKRVDLVVKAFNDLGRKLVIIGDGPDRAVLEKMSRPNITLPRAPARSGSRGLLRAMQGAALPGRRGLRDRAARGECRRASGDRVQGRRRARHGDRRRDRDLLQRADARIAERTRCCARRRRRGTASRSGKHAEDYAEPRFRERFMRLVEGEVEKKHGAAGIKALREALGAVPATA